MILTKPWFVLLSLNFTKRCSASQLVPNGIVTPPRLHRSAVADGAPEVPRSRAIGADVRKLGDASQQLLSVRGGAGKEESFLESSETNRRRPRRPRRPPKRKKGESRAVQIRLQITLHILASMRCSSCSQFGRP